MADISVVGSGPAGLAFAARAAKAGHRVTVHERAGRAGGALRETRLGDDGAFRFDDGAADMLLPAALRDTFRKSGRPLEREVDLVPAQSRTFVDGGGTRLQMPITGRGAQMQAVEQLAGAAAAAAWTATMDGLARRWDAVRHVVETQPRPPRLREFGLRNARAAGLFGRLSADLAALARVDGVGALLLAAAARPVVAAGQRLQQAPSMFGALTYLEHTLGRWRPVGGAGALRDALLARLSLRGVDIHTEEPVSALIESGGRVTGVRTSAGDQAADIVVTAIAPPQLRELLAAAQARPLRRLASRLASLQPAPVPDRVYVGVHAHQAPATYETVLLGSPMLVVRNPADPTAAPAGHTALTIEVHGSCRRDPLDELADRGLDLRAGVVVRHDEPAATWAAGTLVGATSTLRRLAPVAGVAPGLITVGRAAYLPAGLATEVLSAALAAAEIDRTLADAPTTSA